MMQKTMRPLKPLLERDVKRPVKRVLDARGAYWHMPIPPGNINTLDFLACVPVTITPEMVGRTIGCFVAIETKRPGKKAVTVKQAETMKTVRRAGGVAILINDPDESAIADQIKWALRTGYIQAKLSMEG